MSNMSKDEQTQEKNEAEEYARQAREKRLENVQKELPMDKCNGGEAR